MVKESLKLNLGSRDRTLDGYKNIDCDQHPGVDFVGDIADLSRFSDGSVEALRASHCLEHVSHVRTLDVLKEWRRVLVHSGILEVAVPDFARAVEIYRFTGLEDWIQNLCMGDQGYPSATHFAIFDEARLRGLLLEAGFSDVSRVQFFSDSQPNECSNLRSNYDGKPVSLNMLAVK